MANAKKILATTVSHEIFVIRANDECEVRGFCEACAGEVGMLTLYASVILSGITAREIVRLLNEEAVHSIEVARGHLFICEPSLNKTMKTKSLAA